jgi:hypothetical protein
MNLPHVAHRNTNKISRAGLRAYEAGKSPNILTPSHELKPIHSGLCQNSLNHRCGGSIRFQIRASVTDFPFKADVVNATSYL